MKTLLTFSGLLALAAALSPRPFEPKKAFRLRADPAHPVMGSYGFLGMNGQSLQWGTNTTTEVRAFYDDQSNLVFVSQGGILYLRPTHGTPMYYVFQGYPHQDPAPALTVNTWQLRTTSDGKTWLGPASFLGCPSSPKGPANVFLYFGPPTAKHCSGNFGLEVVYDEPQGPEPTVTETATVSVTRTVVEEETETCTTEEPEPTTTEDCTTEEPEPTTTEDCTTEEPEPTTTEDCTTEEPEPTTTEDCTTEEPEPTTTEDCTTADEPEPTEPTVVIPTGTGGPVNPPANSTSTFTRPPIPTETGEEPVSAAAGLSARGSLWALVVAGGLAVYVL